MTVVHACPLAVVDTVKKPWVGLVVAAAVVASVPTEDYSGVVAELLGSDKKED